jgi:molybdopterin converting factor subunit 1
MQETALHLRVYLFSVLRERLGHEMLEIVLPAPATGKHLLDYLMVRFPEITAYRSVIRLAVNHTYVPESTFLAEGDEIALITPVSGG